VAFKKTFSYAGFEMQPKKYNHPKIALLNIELELKAERDNAEVRVESIKEYQRIVDAEWKILYEKLDLIHKSGAQVVLSKLPIGDVATQYFADRYVDMKIYHILSFLLFTCTFILLHRSVLYGGWNFNSGNYLFTTDTK